MAAFERDLKRVLADERDVLHTQLDCVQTLDASKASRRASFAATLGARACPSKPLGRVAAAVSVLPRDDHDLAFAIDIDREWKGIGVFQVGVTGR